MIALAFWNIGKNRDIYNEVADLICEISSCPSISGPDGEVLIGLAEPGDIDDAKIITSLRSQSVKGNWWARWSIGKRFLLLSNIQPTALTSLPEQYGCFPNQLTRYNSNPKSFPLWFVHLDSPLNSRSSVVHGITEGFEFRKSIDKFETDNASIDTIAIGDFNMTPYDAGMVAPHAINAVPCRSVAAKISRKIKGLDHAYFFNPMWELLGSVTKNQHPGSYFMRLKDDSTQWYLIDQAIVRPSMVASIVGKPRILTSTGKRSLLTPGNLIDKKISDHLPLLLSLNI